jgi:ATP-dependent DNA helicase RecQ
MSNQLKSEALLYLRQALSNPQADFRDGQWEAVETLIQNNERLLVVQRTGWGKSLVYFLATYLLRKRGKGPTLLISPLLALMRNQIIAAERMSVKAATINSENQNEWQSVQESFLANQVDILLISPERLANENFRDNILLPISRRIGLFVVDEAHCISDWGHDFRPDYRRIVRILQALPPNIPVLATTATANNRVLDDIKIQLGTNLRVIRGSLTRKSLQLQNIYLPSQAERMAWLVDNLNNLPGSGIIYALTIRDAERIAEFLRLNNINAQAYHSKIENSEGNTQEREGLEAQLLNNQVKALVATTALAMGFDKPDLGFVIHFQRPGSVVHYYQQVGRAGRAVEQAYGILLSGNEDEEITNYFIKSAFPPLAHTQQVLDTLRDSESGLSVPQLERQLNLSNGQINKVLKLLSVESPTPLIKQGSQWYATPIQYQPDTQKIDTLTRIRQAEQKQMRNYMEHQECLMEFLAKALDDPNASPCGKCSCCLNQSFWPEVAKVKLIQQATNYLRGSDQVIKPRKKWPNYLQLSWGVKGNIAKNLQAEEGRALSLWGDAGWGSLVKQGKFRDNHFDDVLVKATLEMIKKWKPHPIPTWITCIPSLNRPELVPNFTQRLSQELNLPFKPVIKKVRQTPPQKTRNNSYQQVTNLDGSFEVEVWQGMKEPVLLIDDMIDSGWTFTITTALLRHFGSGHVFPVALALNSLSQDS